MSVHAITAPVGQHKPAQRSGSTGFSAPARGWSGTRDWLRRSAPGADARGGSPVTPGFAAALRRQPPGTRLPAEVAHRFGEQLGADLTQVRVHDGSSADTLARTVHSVAFSTGSDIYFSAGTYNPRTLTGQRLLAHELAHVVTGARTPGVQRSAMVIGPVHDPAERAADVLADTVVAALARSGPGGAAGDDVTRSRLDRPLTGEPIVSTDHTIRRKFGFEYELKVPVFSRGGSGEPAPPVTSGDVKLAQGDGFQVHVDHSSSVNKVVPSSAREEVGAEPMAAILELATDALDEMRVSEDFVRNQIQKASDFATSALTASRRSASGTEWTSALFDPATLLDNLRNVTHATPPGTNYVGPAYEPNEIQPLFARTIISNDAYTQATQGVSLKALPKHFRKQAGEPSTIKLKYKKALIAAVRIGGQVTDWLMPKTLASGFGLRNKSARTELTGYFTAIAFYLRAALVAARGEQVEGTLGKNLIGPYFFKTGLHTVGNQLRAKYPIVSELLAASKIDELTTKVLAVSKRQPGNEFLPFASGFSCETWLRGVLSGTDDLALKGWKNAWSAELDEPDIGQGSNQGVGLVIESRRFAETLGQGGKRYAPTEWPDLAVRVYYQQLMLNGDKDQRRRATAKLNPTAPRARTVGKTTRFGRRTGRSVPSDIPPPPPLPSTG